MSMQEHLDPAAPPAGLDAEPERPPTHRYSWSAAQILVHHLDACVRPLAPTPPEENDERRRVLVGLLEDAWKADPYLTLGQLLERTIRAAGGGDLDRLPDVALIVVLADMTRPPEEPF